ncbi:MAG: hemolysin III family protein [Bdellovibrionales bacterium]|nr:hemolysin III family protein [Bdellovibrionales bacterium]
MKIRRKPDHSLKLLFQRTLAAQFHALGCILIFIGSLVLLPLASKAGPLHFWACFSFCASGFLLLLISSSYHFMVDGFDSSSRLHDFFENLDHFAIYLFIAGTYTPFVMRAIAPPWRNIIIISVWAIAVLGITYTWLKPRLPKVLQHRMIYTGIFVLMGWAIMIRIGELYHGLSIEHLVLFVGGGLAYSVGAIVYATKRPRLWAGVFGFHELWHLFVLAGAALHYFLILSLYRQLLPV